MLKCPLGCEAVDADGKYITDVQGPVGGIVGPGFDIAGIIIQPVDSLVSMADGLGEVMVKKHPVTGCIQKFAYPDGTDIPPSTPGWLNSPKVTVDFGNFDNRICREGMIAVKGSPIEYWGYAYGSYYCIGAYDPAKPAWYQPCRAVYP